MKQKKYDVLASGYVSMDRIVKIKSPAAVGFTSLIENKTSADIQYGGCAVNISHNMCRLGSVAMPAMRVGDDYKEIGFQAFLEDAGIPLDALEVLEGEKTSQCYLIQDNEGQHITLFYPGAMDGKFAAPLPDALFENAALGLMTVGAKEDNEYFLASCKQHNLPLVLSMKGDMEAFPEAFLQELLEYSRIIFTNEVERATIEKLVGCSILDLLTKGNAEIVITTLGEEGSRCYCKDDANKIQEEYVPICDYGTPVDTTGCGDGYVAGFLYGYQAGKTPRECAMLGTVLSSFIIEKEGCCTGAPNQAALMARYEKFAKQEGAGKRG